MKNQNNILIHIAIGLAIGVLMMFAFNCNNNNPIAPAITEPKERIKIVEVAEMSASKTIDSLRAISSRRMDSINKLTKIVKTKIINLKTAEAVIRAYEADTAHYVPSAYKEAVNDYVSNAGEQAAACEEITSYYQSELANRDSILAQKDKLTFSIRQQFNGATQDVSSMQGYNKQLKKQINRKKFGNVVWKTAAFALLVKVVVGSLK